MNYAPVKFEVARFSGYRMRCIYKKLHYWTFDLDLGAKVTQNSAKYPLHHVTYAPAKFEVTTPKGLGGDAFTRNVTDGHSYIWILVGYFLG